MLLQNIITPRRTLHGAPGTSKKRALEQISALISEELPDHSAEELLAAFMNRERLGSTGIGFGIAIPHCRLENGKKTLGALIQLSTPIDFDAVDDAPVDLLFALIVPEEATDEHLQLLARIAELFSQESFRQALRQCTSSEALYNTLIAACHQSAA